MRGLCGGPRPAKSNSRGVSVGSALQLSERAATPNTGRRARARRDTLRTSGVLQLSAAAPSPSSPPRWQDTSRCARRPLRPSTRPEPVLCEAALSSQLRASCCSGPTLRRRPQLAPLCRSSELGPLPPPEGHAQTSGRADKQTIWNREGLARR